LLDQSERMLAECRKKAERLGTVNRCLFETQIYSPGKFCPKLFSIPH
jgi:hypothetical protein